MIVNGSPAASERLPGHELLARFVMFSRWIKSDGTPKPDAFLPPRDLNLSVTRHSGLSREQLWDRGRTVAAGREKPLLGRADLSAASARDSGAPHLDVVAAPLPENAQHAHIIGWPHDKSRQKMLALKLAEVARFAPLNGLIG